MAYGTKRICDGPCHSRRHQTSRETKDEWSEWGEECPPQQLTIQSFMSFWFCELLCFWLSFATSLTNWCRRRVLVDTRPSSLDLELEKRTEPTVIIIITAQWNIVHQLRQRQTMNLGPRTLCASYKQVMGLRRQELDGVVVGLINNKSPD